MLLLCIIQEFVVHCSIRLLNKVSVNIYIQQEFLKKGEEAFDALDRSSLLFIVGYISKKEERKKRRGTKMCFSSHRMHKQRELPMPLYHDGRDEREKKKIPKASADGYRSPNPLSMLSAASLFFFSLSQCALLVIYSS